MRLSQVRLKNFKGFKQLQLDLHPRLTLLAGVNGAGKSSVLDGLAVAIGSWFLGFHDLKDRGIHKDEVHRVQDGFEHPNIEPHYPVSVEARAMIGAADVWWARHKNSERGTTTRSDAGQLIDFAKADQLAIQERESVELPILAYYGCGRSCQTRNAKLTDTDELSSRTSGYLDALDPASSLADLTKWMRWRERGRLQRQLDTQRFMANQGLDASTAAQLAVMPKGTDDPWLMAVTRAVVACIDDAEDFYYSLRAEELYIRLKTGTTPYAILSDGYRSLITLVADIAWRATRLNTQYQGNASAKTDGVVLIDEIELHLHPKWQRSVLPNLMRTFPKVQFVITTHSPQVIASVDRDMVRILDGDSAHPISMATKWRDSNALLEDIMGVPARPQAALKALNTLFELIDAGRLDDAQTQLLKLEARMGLHDAELTRARWLIDNERMLTEAHAE